MVQRCSTGQNFRMASIEPGDVNTEKGKEQEKEKEKESKRSNSSKCKGNSVRAKATAKARATPKTTLATANQPQRLSTWQTFGNLLGLT